MKKIEEYKDDVYTCTKCGLCQSICPVYKQTKNECALSKGQFILLNGVLNKEIEFTKRVSMNLDYCLNCNLCNEYCPSGIDAESIIIAAREKSFELGHVSFLKRFASTVFSSNFNLSILSFFINIYRFFIPVFRLFEFISPVFIANRFLQKTVEAPKNLNISKTSKIVYFQGCINRYFNDSTTNAVLKTLKDYNLNIPDFSCCGAPAKSIGDIKTYNKLMKKNLKLVKDADVVLFDCATCLHVFDNYETTDILKQKFVHINEFIVRENIETPRTKDKVTYHLPCHLHSDNTEVLLDRNFDYKEVENHSCCGASGLFCATQSDISKGISKTNMKNLLKTNTDVILTDCPSCKIGLLQGLKELKQDKPVYQTVEFLAK